MTVGSRFYQAVAMRLKWKLAAQVGFSIAVSCLCPLSILAQENLSLDVAVGQVLDEEQWDRVDKSIDRALLWLTSQQSDDGSFPTARNGQPGVTSLCAMSFLAQGHQAGQGEYGSELAKALQYIASCQKRSGILAASAPDTVQVPREVDHHIGLTSAYNHAISGLVLSEAYAVAGPNQSQDLRLVIEKALDASRVMQDLPKDQEVDEGGWRYLHDFQREDSDLSVTGWQIMFLRSAKNAGFDVEQERIKRAVAYVRRCFNEEHGTFMYKLEPKNRASRGMAGAGILALAHSGTHETPEARRAGDWILESGFDTYNTRGRLTGVYPNDDRYHYGLLTCSQAMYQLGGRHWKEFFPPVVDVLLENQNPNGSWPPDWNQRDAAFGQCYSTALGVLVLSAPNEVLPIFQR